MYKITFCPITFSHDEYPALNMSDYINKMGCECCFMLTSIFNSVFMVMYLWKMSVFSCSLNCQRKTTNSFSTTCFEQQTYTGILVMVKIRASSITMCIKYMYVSPKANRVDEVPEVLSFSVPWCEVSLDSGLAKSPLASAPISRGGGKSQ